MSVFDLKGDENLKGIIKFSIKNKLAIWLLTFIIVASGIYAGLNMKMETLPNFNYPVVTITTVYPGASPQEVTDKVTEPIETSIKSVGGIKNVISTSAANVSSILVEFEDFDQDMDQAVNDLKMAIDKISLPENIEQPEISKIDINDFPILGLSVFGENKSLERLTIAVEKGLVPKLEGISGVHSVEIAGQLVEEVELKWKTDQLKKYGLTANAVLETLQQSNLSAPIGLFHIDQKMKTVVIDGKRTTIDDLKKLNISAAASGAARQMSPQPTNVPQITLQEVADLQVVKKSKSISRTDGKESIGIQILKSADANTVEVVNQIKDEIRTFEDNNDGFHVTTSFDQGKPIEDSVNTMLEKALLGALFAVIIILLFLRNIRSTFIAVLSIPLSLLIAIVILHWMDISLNIMTLGAMTVAIGRVVDDSIVVIENIYRRLSLPTERLRGKELIIDATREMFIPIFSSTIVTIAVFLPLGFVTGPVGELFMSFAITVVFSLLASLLVAVTLVPMLGHAFFKKHLGTSSETKEEEKKEEKKASTSRLASIYKEILVWALNHKWITVGAAFLILLISLFLIPAIGVSFIPNEEEKNLTIAYNPVPSDPIEKVKDVAKRVDQYFDNKRDVESVHYTVGGDKPADPTARNQVLFTVKYREDTIDFARKKEEVLSDLRAIEPKGTWSYQDMGVTQGHDQLTLFVYGDDMKQIQPTVNEIVKLLGKNDKLSEVKSSISEAYDQYTLTVDHNKLSRYGLTTGQIAQYLSVNGENPVVSTVNHKGKELDVRVAANKEQYKNVNELLNQKLLTPTGQEIALKDVVKLSNGKTSHQISKRNDEVFAEITATIKDKDVQGIIAEAKKEIDDEIELPSGVKVEAGGVSEMINESFTQLGYAILAAIAIVYVILILTFGEAKAPFAILFSLPFIVTGALIGLFVSGETISVSAMIGTLMLIGIVVTNAIVLVDRVINKEKEGYSTREALIEAGMTRLRPILMTAIATIGALIPLAIGIDEGSGGLISKGLAVTVIGGLTSSTLLTLVIVPIVYELLMKRRKA